MLYHIYYDDSTVKTSTCFTPEHSITNINTCFTQKDSIIKKLSDKYQHDAYVLYEIHINYETGKFDSIAVQGLYPDTCGIENINILLKQEFTNVEDDIINIIINYIEIKHLYYIKTDNIMGISCKDIIIKYLNYKYTAYRWTFNHSLKELLIGLILIESTTWLYPEYMIIEKEDVIWNICAMIDYKYYTIDTHYCASNPNNSNTLLFIYSKSEISNTIDYVCDNYDTLIKTYNIKK